jgi:hypothetical protein
MLEAIKTVQAALDTDEQKARFNELGAQQSWAGESQRLCVVSVEHRVYPVAKTMRRE